MEFNAIEDAHIRFATTGKASVTHTSLETSCHTSPFSVSAAAAIPLAQSIVEPPPAARTMLIFSLLQISAPPIYRRMSRIRLDAREFKQFNSVFLRDFLDTVIKTVFLNRAAAIYKQYLVSEF